MMLICIIIFAIAIYLIYYKDGRNRENVGDQLRCYNCGHIIKDDYYYCPNCKEKLKTKCEACGRPIGVNWRHCPYCNHPNLDRKVDV